MIHFPTRDTNSTQVGSWLRPVRYAGLETRTARLKLPVARKPVFIRIGPGLSLGYRRNQVAGTRVLRLADGKGGATTKAIETRGVARREFIERGAPSLGGS